MSGPFPSNFGAALLLRLTCVATVGVRLLSASPAIPFSPAQAPAFRGGVDLVDLGVTVTDRRGQLVAGLEAKDFEVREDGRLQTVRYFVPGRPAEGAPQLHLGMLLDVSESMSDDIRFTRTAAIKFLNALTDAVDITVVDFDSEVRVARYGQAEFPRLVERIRQRKPTGMTALYDAIGVYLDGAGSLDGRKLMLLYTDGGDTRSAMRWSELLTLLKASDVTVYAIGEMEHQSSSARVHARSILQAIAETTGGAAFFPSTVKELDGIYDKILAEIHAQYTIAYHSTNAAADGAWRKVEVTIAQAPGRDLRVRTRKGYFASFKPPAKP